MLELDELKAALRVRGLVAAGDVTIVAVEPHGAGVVDVVFRSDEGQIGDRLLTAEQVTDVEPQWLYRQ